ncbi:MAG: hypothetical protein KKF12_12525 [Proteobacteria bacterium]|nr:hypothetical protein [Pseudomonadota bacterium]
MENSENSILIAEERKRKDIIVAVPHHAPLGTSKLPCEAHPDADENAGVLGYYISRLLNCCSVIACNYFIDPNKSSKTDYYNKIKSWKPKFLVEIHGHGSRSARYDIEISSGKAERNNWSKTLAEKLEAKMSLTASLQKYKISGDFNKIHFQASKSATIKTDEWIPFHIELPKSIRSKKSEYLLFCEILAETIKEVMLE